MICPCIAMCREKVTVEHYSNICSNMVRDAYKDCPIYQRIVKEVRTPSEWAVSLAGMRTPPTS